MSGGSHNYGYYHLDDYIESIEKYDCTLSLMLRDVRDLCHDIEWCESGDIDENDLNESIKKFKEKWLIDD